MRSIEAGNTHFEAHAAGQVASIQEAQGPVQEPAFLASVPQGARESFTPGFMKKPLVAIGGLAAAILTACGGDKAEGADVTLVTRTPGASDVTSTAIVDSTPASGKTVIVVRPSPTIEVSPTPTKTPKEIALDAMPAQVKAFYIQIEGLNETVFKGTDVTPEVVEKSLLKPLEEIQMVVDKDAVFEANRDYAGYIGLLNVLRAQYYARNRNPEIKNVAQNITRFLQETYPEKYNKSIGSGSIEADFVPPSVK